MDRFALKLAVIAGAMLGASAAPAAAPGNDPRLNQRLEAALGTYVISQLDRSVQLSRTIPSVAMLRKPAIDDGDAIKVGEDIYVDRRLMPGRGTPSGEDAVRIFRRDAR